jgi:hypothetical protein
MRVGKKTVAIVGSDWMTGPWAPFGETEVWGMNMLHGLPWYKVEDTSRWYELHPKEELISDSKQWEWLREDHGFPIYTMQTLDAVPNSVIYPLYEIQDKLLNNVYRGEEKIKKLFSSSFNYQIAHALLEGYKLIEIYGISLVEESEYAYQREAMAYWIGKADGMGVKIWLPESCALLIEPLYCYEYT